MRRTRGFTLVEVIVALSIMALSILLVTRALLTLMYVTNVGGNRTVASALAVRKLEEVRGRPESQSNSSGWIPAFDAIVNEGPASFLAPFTNYSFLVSVNQVIVTPGAAWPAWLDQPPYHSNTMKFVTVEVSFRGQPLARVSSAVIRDMYKRPP